MYQKKMGNCIFIFLFVVVNSMIQHSDSALLRVRSKELRLTLKRLDSEALRLLQRWGEDERFKFKKGMNMENKMNRHIFYLTIALTFLLSFSQNSYAVDIRNMADQGTLRCAGGIVAIGASDREVLDKCGEPLDVQRLQDVGPVWIYQMGQSKFMHYLAFLHGKLQRIASAPCRSNDYSCYDLR